MKDLWQPEMSSAGSKAALIAHRDGGKLDLWQPTASKDGNSAAAIAMRTKGLSPELDRGYTADGKSKALMAATLSIHKKSTSQPAPSAPPAYPDAKNSAHNALNAATVSHRASVRKPPANPAAPDGWNSEANQAARITNARGNIAVEMYGERPPVEIEQEEKRQKAALHASAVSMAKQMYDYQNRTMLEPDMSGGRAGADAANARKVPTEQLDVKQEALRYIHLQDAAHKLAQERLAKIDKGFENAKYREHYGYPDKQPSNARNRLSVRGRNRNRAGSESAAADFDSSDDDEEQARRIRSQMTQLNTGLSQVDEKKRTDDRAKLLAAAEKKVHAQMHNMDEKVFADTGKVPPAMMEEWEAKARKRAEENRELESRPENKGKTHIGGGKFIDQSEIEAIALARLKPTLDEINETAEKKRARDEEIRIAKDKEHTRQMEEKIESRKQKDEWKAHRGKSRSRPVFLLYVLTMPTDHDKAAARKEKDEAKLRKEEEKQRAKEEKRKSREAKRPTSTEIGGAVVAGEAADDREEEPQNPDALKRRSTFGRIAGKLRRNKQPEAAKGVEKMESEENNKPLDAPAVVLGTAGVATGGVAVGEAAEQPRTDDVEAEEERERLESEPVSPIESEDDEPVGASTERPALAEHQPSYLRPNLERVATEIADSSDEGDSNAGFDSDSDDDIADPDRARNEDELAEKGKHHFANLGATTGNTAAGDQEQGETHRIIDRVFGAPVDETFESTTDRPIDEPRLKKEEHNVARDTAVASGAGAVGAGVADIEKEEISVQSGPKKLSKQKEAAVLPPPTAKAGTDEPLQAQEPPEKEQKGLRGFFSKLRSKQPKQESEVAKPKTFTETKTSTDSSAVAAAAPATKDSIPSEQPSSTHVGTDGPIGDDHKGMIGSDISPTSSSSFQRHKGDLRNASDVSSSGAEEEDLERGRSGGGVGSRMKDWGRAEFGLGSLEKSGHQKTGKSTEQEGDDDDDDFQEARDHFDERLAPPPAFAGQAKSESPSRTTKFKEEV